MEKTYCTARTKPNTIIKRWTIKQRNWYKPQFTKPTIRMFQLLLSIGVISGWLMPYEKFKKIFMTSFRNLWISINLCLKLRIEEEYIFWYCIYTSQHLISKEYILIIAPSSCSFKISPFVKLNLTSFLVCPPEAKDIFCWFR